MLLFVTGPGIAEEARARRIYTVIASSWPEIARRRTHPRSGSTLTPAVTRLDLFLAAFSPASTPGDSGLAIHVPPGDQWWQWAPALRRGMRELLRSTFPSGPRYAATFDPVGPRMARPSPAATRPLRTLASELTSSNDPAQRPVDPRLWLVLAPPLPEGLEALFLPMFLRAEPFARIARVPDGREDLTGWLENEVDGLIAGDGLVTDGLVIDLDGMASMPTLTECDEGGKVRSRSRIFDLVSGLEDLYASKEMLEPGEAYNRLHSHTASEELYIVLEGEGVIRVNERVLPIRAGQCFGKPRGYDCSSQILNTGEHTLVFLDVGTLDTAEVDVYRYPEHGELIVRLGGHGCLVPDDAILPRSELFPVYDRRYYRSSAGPTPEKPPGPAKPTGR